MVHIYCTVCLLCYIFKCIFIKDGEHGRYGESLSDGESPTPFLFKRGWGWESISQPRTVPLPSLPPYLSPPSTPLPFYDILDLSPCIKKVNHIKTNIELSKYIYFLIRHPKFYQNALHHLTPLACKLRSTQNHP